MSKGRIKNNTSAGPGGRGIVRVLLAVTRHGHWEGTNEDEEEKGADHVAEGLRCLQWSHH